MRISKQKLVLGVADVIEDFAKSLMFVSCGLEKYEEEIICIAAIEIIKNSIKKDIENYEEKEALASDLIQIFLEKIQEEQNNEENKNKTNERKC